MNKTWAIGYKSKGKTILTELPNCEYKQAWKIWRKLQKRKTSAFMKELNTLFLDDNMKPLFDFDLAEVPPLNLTFPATSKPLSIAFPVPQGILKGTKNE